MTKEEAEFDERLGIFHRQKAEATKIWFAASALVADTVPISALRPGYNDSGRRLMDARKRAQNERKFGSWDALPDGGRRYSFEVTGRSGWRARYVKEVDAAESTVKFYQEIYDAEGRLREVHHKYPVDLGHQQVVEEES